MTEKQHRFAVLWIWLLLVFMYLLGARSYGQPPGQAAKVARMKLHDTTAISPDLNNKRATIDIDSLSFTLWSWGEECWFRIDLANALMSMADSVKVDSINGYPRVRFYSGKLNYELMVTESGNFEWFAILNEKPPGLSTTFDFESQGLVFYYQAPFANGDTIQYDIADELIISEADTIWPGDTIGWQVRPDSVAGSYALYHSTKIGNILHDDGSVSQYLTGKAGHIFAAYAWDSDGDTVKMDMVIDTAAGTLTLSLPSNQWKNQANYPVRIDPTFGTTGVGGTGDTNGTNDVRHCMYTMGGTAGTADSVTIYVSDDNNTSDIGTAIYDDQSTDCNNLIDTATAEQTTIAWQDAWMSFGMAIGVSLSASTDYWLTGGSGATCTFKYDDNNTDTTQGHFSDAWPFSDPCSGNWDRNDWTYSIYCTYTESGGGAVFPVRRRRTQTGGQ